MLQTGRRKCYREDKHYVKGFLHASLPTGFVLLSPSLPVPLVLSSCFSGSVVFVLRAVMEESGHFALAPHKALRILLSDGFFVFGGAPPCSDDALGKSYTDTLTSCHLLPSIPKSR